MATLLFETVDVFTTQRFSGNPLAVVHIPRHESAGITQEQKSQIAREFNLSETIFIHENPDNALDRKLDIFIATGEEIPFAGHPTIGALCSIGAKSVKGDTAQNIIVHEKAGDVIATFDPQTGLARASIPHNIHQHVRGVTGEYMASYQPKLKAVIHEQKFPLVSPVNGMTFALVKLDDLDSLAKCQSHRDDLPEVHREYLDGAWKPSFVGVYFYVELGEKLGEDGILTQTIRSRMMCADVPEDPATGSAACTLAGWLSQQRRVSEKWFSTPNVHAFAKIRRFRYEILQGVEMGRESRIMVEVTMKEDGESTEIERVELCGQAVKVMDGQLLL